MPAFDHGAVTIVACPDAEGAATMPAHHHGERKRFTNSVPMLQLPRWSVGS